MVATSGESKSHLWLIRDEKDSDAEACCSAEDDEGAHDVTIDRP